MYTGPFLVVAATLIQIPVAGFMHSFGIFVKKLDDEFCPGDCLQELGWVSSLGFGTNLVLCIAVTRFQKLFPYPRILFLSGVVLCSAGLLATSWITKISHAFLTYCLLFGVGSSLVMYTPYEIADEHYPHGHRYHVLATSIMTIGAPLGVIIMNPLCAHLDKIESHSWRDTLKIFSATILLLGGVCAVPLVAPPRPSDANPEDYEELEPGTKGWRKNMTCTLAKSILFWVLGTFLLAFAVFIPKTHFAKYFSTLGIEDEKAAMAIGYGGISELVASLAISLLGRFISRHVILVYVISSATIAMGMALLTLATTEWQVIVYNLVHGCVDGATLTVVYPTVGAIVSDSSMKADLFGLTFMCLGVGEIIGLPVAGMLFDMYHSYRATFYVGAAAFGSASLCYLVVYITQLKTSCQNDTEETNEMERAEEPPDSKPPATNTEVPLHSGLDDKE